MRKHKNVRRVQPEEFSPTIEDVAAMGEGLARKDGEPVFVPYTIPGEKVRAEINRRGRRYLEANVLQIIEPSPHRVEAPCPYYQECTGCQWQHIDYAHQLDLKRHLVIDQLQRIGRFENPPVPPAIGCADPWHYRNHARFTVRGGKLGFMNNSTRRFVAIDRCLIMDEGINAILGQLQGKCAETSQLSIRLGINTGACLVQPSLKAGEVGVSTGQQHYEEEILGRPFRVSSPSFFQVNSHQAARLVELVWARLNLSGHETLL